MRKFRLLALPILFIFLAVSAGQAAVTPVAPGTPVLGAALEKLGSYTVKDLQKLAGRKLSVKEKVSFWLFKRQLKKHGGEAVVKILADKQLKYQQKQNKKGKAGEPGSNGQTAFIFGLLGALLLVAAFFVPYVIFGSLVSAILAIAIGSVAAKRNPDDAKARTGKLLGWLTLGLFVIILIIAVIALSTSDWW